jgi:phage baseplate assembly protein W
VGVGRYGQTIDISSPFFARLENDQRILAQAVYRRLNTKKGSLWTDPTYGISVQDYVLAGLTTDALARIPAEVQAELEQDERIGSAAVTATRTRTEAGGYALELTITITPKTSGTFSLVLAVSELSVQILTREVA